MTVAKFTQPNYTTQTASEYKANLDAAAAVHQRLGGAFAAHEVAAPNMTVVVDAGSLISGTTLTEKAQQTTGAIAAPVGNPRIDRIVIDGSTGAVSVIAGAEAASPSAPAITSGKIPVAQVLLQTGTAVITNSMITDERVAIYGGYAALGGSLAQDFSAKNLSLGGTFAALSANYNGIAYLQSENLNAGGNVTAQVIAKTDAGELKMMAYSLNTGAEGYIVSSLGGLTIRTAAVAPLKFGTNSIEQARIHTNGYFGIRTTSPEAPLHVSGPAYLQQGNGYLKIWDSGRCFSGGVGIESQASGGGLEIGTNAAQILSLYTAAIERMRFYADGARSTVIPGGSTLYPSFDVRAWVNFNGTGTVAIRASGNVSSITDNGVGDYTINFTTAMPDANYAFSGSCQPYGSENSGGTVRGYSSATQLQGSCRIVTRGQTTTVYDTDIVNVIFVR